MRPPWLSFLTEPIYAALEQAEARVRDLEGELLRLDPEHFRRLKEGTNQPAEVSAENRSSSHETHPADAAWLASEQARIAGLTERELADLMSTLEAKLGAEALDLLLAGASLSEAGIDADADLERLVERLRGFTGGEDAR